MNKLLMSSIRRFAAPASLCAALCAVSALPVAAADSPQPKVIVDQGHFNALAMNRLATWKLTSLTDALTAGGYAVQSLNGTVTPDSLAGCSVLVITAPSFDYWEDEKAAIQAFVNGGGGLLLTADYGVDASGYVTDWAPVCQSLAGLFSYTLDNNWPVDTLHNESNYKYWITLGASCLGTHPVLGGVSGLQSYSMTTLTGSPGSAAIAHTDGDATPANKTAIAAGPYGTGKLLLSGSSMYFADPVPNRPLGNGQYAEMNGINASGNRAFAYNSLTWLARGPGRPLVNLTSPSPGALLYGSVDVNGMVWDATLTGYTVEYAPAANPTSWTAIPPAGSASTMSGRLATWDTSAVPQGDYLLKVTAVNAPGGEFSRTVPVTVKTLHQVSTIAGLKTVAEGDLVSLTGKEVVAGTDDLLGKLYIEESDRSAGVAVVGGTADRGTKATVIGTLSRTGSEPMITAVSLTTAPFAGPYIRPLGMTNASAGPAAVGLQRMGVLVRVFGNVSALTADGFMLTDGSTSGGIRVITSLSVPGISAPAVGTKVAVTGIGSSYSTSPVVVVRRQEDIRTLVP